MKTPSSKDTIHENKNPKGSVGQEKPTKSGRGYRPPLKRQKINIYPEKNRSNS